jgi:hypothetical protein
MTVTAAKKEDRRRLATRRLAPLPVSDAMNNAASTFCPLRTSDGPHSANALPADQRS